MLLLAVQESPPTILYFIESEYSHAGPGREIRSDISAKLPGCCARQIVSPGSKIVKFNPESRNPACSIKFPAFQSSLA